MRLSANGIRQPQVRNCSPDIWLKASTARLARNNPQGTPNCGQEAISPRDRSLRAHSIHQYRAAPFTADADTLDESQDGEDHGAPDADALIGRDQRDRESRQSHQQQGRDQRRLAADAIAVMAENGSPDRPRNEADGVDGEGFERSDPRVRMRKKQLGEDQAGDGAVEEKIIPRDRGADGRGDHGAAQLNLMFRRGEGSGVDIGYCHERPSSAAAFPNQIERFGWQTCCVPSGFRVGPLESQKSEGFFSPSHRIVSRQM